MANNDLIVYEALDKSSNGEITVQGKKKAKGLRFLKGVIGFLLTIVLLVGAYFSYPYISLFFAKENSQNEDPNLSIGKNPPSNETENKPSEEKSYDFKINEVVNNEYKITNESSCEIDFSATPTRILASDTYKKYGKDAPFVLITHFSRNEAYSDGIGYNYDSEFYSTKNNVGDIGAEMCTELNRLGINAIHLNEVYASGGIHNSFSEYESSVKEVLSKYPSIAYVLNLSRGTKINKDMSMDKHIFEKDGKKYATLCLISGTSSSSLSKSQERNILFALDFAKEINNKSSGFVSENVISNFSLVQSFEPICTEIEIGSFACSYEEARESILLLASEFYRYVS